MSSNRLLSVTTSHVTQHFLFPFARHFRERGWRVDALARGISGSAECREAFDRTIEIDWSRNPSQPRNLLSTPAKVRAIVEEGGYDLVHVHTPVAAFITRLALRNRKGSPAVIYTAHGFHFYEGAPALQNALFRNLERLAGRWTDYLVVMNSEDLQGAKRHRIVPPERLRYMPGIGIELERYAGKEATAEEIDRVRCELGMAPQEALFLMVAEFIPRKRHADILHAFARLRRDDVHLALAGEGPLKERMRALARTLGIDRRVHFLGFRSDIPALTGASTALLLPSRQEGLPRSIMEAFCMERICIGSDIRGTRDLVGSDGGKLVPVGDVEGFASSMAWALEHPEEVARMGRAAREKLKDYEVGKIIRLHEELYHEALNTPAHGALRKGWIA